MPSRPQQPKASTPDLQRTSGTANSANSGNNDGFPRYWPWLLCCALGAWLSLSRLHALQNADSILPSILSLTTWTPFFWRQNRYGMLWPLVCRGVHHPLWNVVCVMFCNVTAGLAAHFLLARVLWREKGPWAWTGLLSIFVTLLFGSPHFVFESLSAYQFMTTPLALGCAAVVLLRSRPGNVFRYGCACVLFASVAWYNPAAPVMLGAILFWQLLLPQAGPRRSVARGAIAWARVRRVELILLLLTGLSTALGLYVMHQSRWHMAAFDQNLSPRDWCAAVLLLSQKMFLGRGDEAGAPWLAAAAGLGALLVLVGAAWRKSSAAWQGVWPMAAGLLAAATYGVAISRRAWVQHEGYVVRYFVPVLFVAVVATCVGLVGLLSGSMPRGQEKHPPAKRGPWARLFGAQPRARQRTPFLGASAVAATLVCTAVQFGRPSYRQVEAWMTSWAGGVGQELLDYQLSHVAGKYWDAWPAMLYANWKRYTQHDLRRVFAIAHRYDATVPLMPKDVGTWRVGLLKGSLEEARMYLAGAGLGRLEVVGETPHLIIVRVAAP